MSYPLRVAVAGAGIGEQYVASFAGHPDAEVVAVCTRTPGSGTHLTSRYDVGRSYTDYETMLEREAPEIVVVAVPNHLHSPMTLAALEAGAHVVCEKPLALDLDEALEMVSRAEERRRCTFVPFTWRFLPAAVRMSELLAAGFVGRPYHVSIRYFVCGWGDPHGPMRWQYDAAAAGSGTLANIGSHSIHLVQWWLGDFRRVCALLGTLVPERLTATGTRAHVSVDDTCVLLGELEDGTPVALDASSVAYGPRVDLAIRVSGSDGALVFEDDWAAADAHLGRLRGARAGDAGWTPIEVPHGGTRADSGRGTPLGVCFDRMAAEVVSAVRENRTARPSFRDGLRVQRVLDAALRSAARESWQTVAEPSRTAVATDSLG